MTELEMIQQAYIQMTIFSIRVRREGNSLVYTATGQPPIIRLDSRKEEDLEYGILSLESPNGTKVIPLKDAEALRSHIQAIHALLD